MCNFIPGFASRDAEAGNYFQIIANLFGIGARLLYFCKED